MADAAKSDTRAPDTKLSAAKIVAPEPSFTMPPPNRDATGRTPGVPDFVNPATNKRWDETIPGGAYVDAKTHRVHDAEGRPLDRDDVLAKGVALPPLKVVVPQPTAEPNPAVQPL
jgi:hypothetical protein